MQNNISISHSITDYPALFKKAWAEVIEDMDANETTISKYFSPDYSQWVDGKSMDYDGFVRHISAQKQMVQSIKTRFVELIAYDNVLSTIHDVTATKRDGSISVLRVIGHMTYEGDKIVKVIELTHVLSGDSKDTELGSIE